MTIPVITVEGNIGAGKTSILQNLEQSLSVTDKFKIKTDHEPVGAFQTFYGNDMIIPLQNFYQNAKENAFLFQNYVLDIYQQRMEALSAVEPMCKVIVMDRGLSTFHHLTLLTWGSYS